MKTDLDEIVKKIDLSHPKAMAQHCEEFSRVGTGNYMKNKIEATDEEIRAAGTYAYDFIRPRKFLKEIDTDSRSELHLFGKWESKDLSVVSPDVVDFAMPNGEIKKLTILPLDVIVVDREKKFVFRSRPSKGSDLIETKLVYHNDFPLLLQKTWGTFSEVKQSVHKLIDLYLKHKHGPLCEGNVKKVAIETNKVVGGKFKHSVPVLRRIFGGRVWKKLNPEICKLAIQISGAKATSLDYTIIWNNLEEVKDTMQKAPGILPVWINLVRRFIRDKYRKERHVYDSFPDIYLNDDDKKENHYGESLLYTAGTLNYEDVDFRFPNIIQNTKLFLEHKLFSGANGEFGITSRAWKYLVKLKPAWTRTFNMATMQTTPFNRMLDVFASVGAVPRLTVMKKLTRFVNGHLYRDAACAAIVRVVEARTRNLTGIKHFWDAEAYLVCDWLNHCDREEEFGENIKRARNIDKLDKNQLKAPWAWFMAQQAEWHENIQRKKREAIANEKWEFILEPFEYKGYNIVPICNSLDLFDEGQEMHHCVSSYSHKCKAGTSRVFSIRKDDLKVATAEIEINNNMCEMVQCRGKCNSKVTSEVESVAKKIAVIYSQKLLEKVSYAKAG